MMKLKQDRRGFTILELTIAVTVFSVMLLIAAGAVTALTRQFYQGLVKSRTQQVARNISEELLTNIQYSTERPRLLGYSSNGEVEGWCIAERAYLFAKGRQLGTDTPEQRPGVAQRVNTCNLAEIPDELTPAAGRVELMGKGMRLASLDICPQSNLDPADPCYGDSSKLWSVKVRVVHGDDDLICSEGEAGDCTDLAPTQYPQAEDATCKFQAGHQYCAMAEFEATAVRRL